MSTYSLSYLTTFVRRVLALNLSEALWVKAELAQVNQSRGHIFLSLIEKSENSDTIIAQVEAVIWNSQLRHIIGKHGNEIAGLLQSGFEVKLKVTADYHDRHGFKLIVSDIDPVHTIGKLAQQRQISIQQLNAEALLEKQSQLTFPQAAQRIAVISSETAAGYADFCQQLLQNPAQYNFELTLFPASMQGELAPTEISHALRKIERRKAYFDLIVIIRGGGARMDLLAFDDLNLCKIIANTSLPVLTGIGHETDKVLIDYVAHKSLKTPTAVATFLLDHLASFENQILHLGASIYRIAQEIIQHNHRLLDQKGNELQFTANRILTNEVAMLQQAASTLPLLGQQLLQLEKQKLLQKQTELAALDPNEILKRGYAILSVNGKIIRSIAGIPENEVIFVQLSNGIEKLVKKHD